ncbi:hypothetical protein H9Q16_18815 [Sulfitobacter sp. TSTF-M16]|uniref:RNase NYN domain-containing protein n=2 Tax=Sulfitobacter aestuariivivens TaxID=2766981 RepID=A0A927HI82_9RHOB|nr:hypothetical protein [Sulfitobacter aestuariivivens]
MLIAAIALAISTLMFRRRLRNWRADKQRIILDGSNVMYWDNETPSLGPVKLTLNRLAAEGYSVGVVFDANAGYKLYGAYRGPDALARRLKISSDRVMIAPKGTPADPLILKAASDMNARVVTNDRYRDWVSDYPAINKPGFLIPGSYRDGAIHLRMPQEKGRKAA